MPLTKEQKHARAVKRNMKAALDAETRAHRHEAKRAEWREHDMYPTRDEGLAGAPCRGCGLPLTDGLGDWPPLRDMTPEQVAAKDAADALYRERHPDCGGETLGTQGSRVTHCMLCCPPLPIPESVLEDLGRFLAELPPRRVEELDVWALELTCGHRVERTAHFTQLYWMSSTVACPECEMTRGVVTSERTTEAEARVEDARREHERAVAKAKQDVAKAEAAARDARAKLAELEEHASARQSPPR